MDFGWDSPNVITATLVCFGAGLATGIGGCVAFMPGILKRFSPALILAVALSISGGVMLYVSFIEIFVKSHDAILTSYPDSPGTAAALTTTFFFLGMLVCVLLEMLLSRINKHIKSKKSQKSNESGSSTTVDVEIANGQKASQEEDWKSKKVAVAGDVPSVDGCQDETCKDETCKDDNCGKTSNEKFFTGMDACGHDHGGSGGAGVGMDTEESREELGRMGALTGLAIALHNFPEGLATFLGTVADPNLGISLGTAIAIHNIPEGICVAMPIYYATGSKWKAFGWSLMSGITEPIGGILGYAVLQPVFTDLVFGLIFSMVGGMMVFIVLHELLPTAHRYMPGRSGVVTANLILGMVVMSLSLVLFVV